ncbi:MAG: hypothetical protein FWE24_04500 [Defluviitaleaceae bacterium]|nr:hypothetical protein [Defluviitaleaceae bacterium]
MTNTNTISIHEDIIRVFKRVLVNKDINLDFLSFIIGSLTFRFLEFLNYIEINPSD